MIISAKIRISIDYMVFILPNVHPAWFSSYQMSTPPQKGWRINCVTLCFGAENETRTRDPDLGKVVLYQLSYFRKSGLQRYGKKLNVQIFSRFFAKGWKIPKRIVILYDENNFLTLITL